MQSIYPVEFFDAIEEALGRDRLLVNAQLGKHDLVDEELQRMFAAAKEAGDTERQELIDGIYVQHRRYVSIHAMEGHNRPRGNSSSLMADR